MYYLKYCNVVIKKSENVSECFEYLKTLRVGAMCNADLSDFKLISDVVDKSYNIRLFIENFQDLPKFLRKENI